MSINQFTTEHGGNFNRFSMGGVFSYGASTSYSPPPIVNQFLLQEDGAFLLQEDGGRIRLEVGN